MLLEGTCGMAGCSKMATRLITIENEYVAICEDCWHEKYKN